VAGQCARAVLLLIGAGLFLRSLQRAWATPAGFDLQNVVTGSLMSSQLRYSEARAQALYRDLLERRTTLGQERLATSLLSIFGLVAVVMAVVGIYGVVSYLVLQRVPEFGARLALGARKNDVLALVLGEAVVVAAVGIGVGAVAAWASTRLVGSLLFDVSPTDPATFAGAALFLFATALAASYLPARRAPAVDSMAAMRHG
jgi:ABC-type antimicrobial peptide transport system permease subunit